MESENPILRAQVSRTDLKSIFHLLVGKPDNTIQILEGPFELDLKDIHALDELIVKKLKNHNIETVNSSVILASSDRTIKEFCSIADLENHFWGGPEETEEITLKWDFLVTLQEYPLPQRHTLTVRAGKGIRPREMLQFLFSQEREDSTYDDIALAAMSCRVDFISAVLGKELINIVKEWHAGLRRVTLIAPWVLKIRKYRQSISQFIELSIPAAVGLLCVTYFKSLLAKFPQNAPFSVELLDLTTTWLSLSIASIFLGMIISKIISARSESSLLQLKSGSASFTLTNGDKNRGVKDVQSGNKQIKIFLFSSFWALAINVIAAVLVYRLGLAQ